MLWSGAGEKHAWDVLGGQSWRCKRHVKHVFTVNMMGQVPACLELSVSHFCTENITSLSNRLETGRGILILQLRV